MEESYFYQENNTADQLDEISMNFRDFDLIKGIKELFVQKLKNDGLDEREFADFRLGTMKKLNNVSVGLPIDEFLREAYVGLLQALLCLKSDNRLSNTSKRLLPQISNALSVIRHTLKEQESQIPNLELEASHYRKNTLDGLASLTDIYLRSKPDYEVLKSYGNFIKDFQIISEITESLEDLQDKIEVLKQGIERPVNDHNVSLFAEITVEMEQRVDLSGFI
ncbi:Hypothetical predicted protein [Paramuricea clavata]|uniref:Uncharacterized protein n=1 Tax=Paramuricea clavata TaxID=317549 RepID=A0A7D9IDT1_PARCT|nr:Hypothetical predicted protein [Paramuricea clavata]